MIDGNGTAPTPVHLLGIGGSPRRGSRSLTALSATLRLAEEAGAATTLADVRTLDLPLYDADRPLDNYPPSLPRLFAEIRAADALLLCTPTYHGTVAGGLKNVLDALDPLGNDDPPYFAGKPVGLMAVGGGGAANAITALQHAVRALNGLTVPTAVMVPGRAVDPATGALTDEPTLRRTRRMVTELLDIAARLRRPATIARAAGLAAER